MARIFTRFRSFIDWRDPEGNSNKVAYALRDLSQHHGDAPIENRGQIDMDFENEMKAAAEVGCCPGIDLLMEKVINGTDALPSLMTRTAQQERDTAELMRLVKGEREGEGLAFHMTQINAWKELAKWEVHFILAGIVAIAALLALRH